MKTKMKTSKVLAMGVMIALLAIGSAAQAAITIEIVPVGNAGNAADTRYETPGYGSVSYIYGIGKYEVTAGQYCEFLNAVAKTDTYGLYNSSMGAVDDTNMGCNIQRTGSSGSYTYSVVSEYANRPVNYVSFWDSCRFANWLTNGQPIGAQGAGTTERGAYTLDGYNGYDGRTIQRNPGATWAVTSEDEWYKAAYYDGVTDTYWDYPTSSSIGEAPGQDMADPFGNNANWYIEGGNYPIASPYYTTVAGEFQNSASPYGTFDQGGNVYELTEGIPYQDSTYACRQLRGGSFDYFGGALLASIRGDYCWPTYENYDIGFRVVTVPTVITLASFDAKPGNGKVTLKWVTATEIDNAGFNILRAESENGEYVQINKSLIPAKGSATQGSSYMFVDTEAANRMTYYYKLQDIDLNGTATMHGPESATPRLIFGMGK